MSSIDRPWTLIKSVCGICSRVDSSSGYEPSTCGTCGARFSLGAPWVAIHVRILKSTEQVRSTIEHSIEAVGDWATADVQQALDVVRRTIGLTAALGQSSRPPLPATPLESEQTETRMRTANDNDE